MLTAIKCIDAILIIPLISLVASLATQKSVQQGSHNLQRSHTEVARYHGNKLTTWGVVHADGRDGFLEHCSKHFISYWYSIPE